MQKREKGPLEWGALLKSISTMEEFKPETWSHF